MFKKDGAILLLLVIAAETAAQYFLEKTADNKRKFFLMIGLALYIVVGYVYYLMLIRGEKLAIANALWNAGTSIAVAVIGYVFFAQKLSKEQMLGLGLIIAGVWLMG